MRETSIAAHESVKPRKHTYKARILATISGFCRTCSELERELGMKHQTCSARLTELYQAGKIVENGEWNGETIWIIAPEGHPKPKKQPSSAEQLRALQRKCCNLLDAYHNWNKLAERGTMDALRGAVHDLEQYVGYEWHSEAHND